MKKVIRNLKTGAFFNHGEWVKDIHQAQPVATVLEAFEIKSAYGLTDVELYYLHGAQPSKRYDFTILLT